MILRVVLGIGLIGAALGTGVATYRVLQPPAALPADSVAEPVAAPPPRMAMLVAARHLPAGTLVKDEDFAARQMGHDAVPGNAIADTPESRAEFHGGLVGRYLEAGTLLSRADLLRPRDRGFLAAVLRPGMRAIAVGVDAVTGAAGLIWPGDQVDLILTQELDATAGPSRRVVGETVLTDIRVIAVDQVFTQGGSANPRTETNGQSPRPVARTVTLEVSPQQAERVAVGERLGRLSLTVRAIDQQGQSGLLAGDVSGSVFGGDVSPALSRSGQTNGTRMRVIQGGELQEVTFR